MSNKLFDMVKMVTPKSNAFDLSHDVKMSLDMGMLLPTLCLEALPGDTFMLGCDSLTRFAPLIAPVMHRMDLTVHYFFCPNRILWPNWENFITSTPVGGSIPAHPFLTIAKDGSNFTKLMDCLGIPDPTLNTGGSLVDERVNALPFAAYQKIYNEYYRDQNLVLEIPYELNDGSNDANMQLHNNHRRAWEHDYFTAALPFAQKGTEVNLPLMFDDVKIGYDGGNPGPNKTFDINGDVNGNSALGTAEYDEPPSYGASNSGELFAKTSDLQGQTTINDLRRATKLQEWLEKAARGGSRYVETLRNYFGVRSSDQRAQRPEYITGIKSPVIISEVLQTSESNTTPQGTMAGHAVSLQQGQMGRYKCEEHGFIMGIVSVTPKTAYMQGIPKHFLRLNGPLDYAWPEFAHIGEQEILNKELYAYDQNGDDTFGYIPRYAEYKYQPSRVVGDFKTTLANWHLGRVFANPPALNQTFIDCNPREDIFAVSGPNIDSIYCHILHKVTAIRKLPKFGNPSF